MKKIKVLILFTLFCQSLLGQQTFDNIPSKYRSLIEENYQILVREKEYVEGIISFESNGIYVHPQSNNQLEFVLYYDEIEEFLSWYKDYDMSQIEYLYLRKGDKSINDKSIYSDIALINPLPHGEKLKVSIDPGHMAGIKEEAIYEDRYVKFLEGKDTVFFHEAELAYELAYLVKRGLDSLGYEVMLTRNAGSSALGISFQEWIKNEYIVDIKTLIANKEITWGYGRTLIEEKDEKELFNKIYTYLDFRERVKKINQFNPDLTLSLHLNAYEYGKRDSNGLSELVDKNYSMSFVPGSFVIGELKKVPQRIDFIRLLVSNNIKESINASVTLQKELENQLNIDSFSEEKHFKSDMISKYTYKVGEGVFARNLYLTQAVESPIIFSEPLLQDNIEEAKLLAMENYRKGDIMTSFRIKQLADVYVQSIHNILTK